MDLVKLLIVLVIITSECTSKNVSVIEHRLGSCTFSNNDTCGYNIQSPWNINEGSYLFMGRIPLLTVGQDDDFYAFFEPPHSDGNPLHSINSPLLPGGTACLSFYYTLPAATATLHVRTRTEDNVTVELWNVTDGRIRQWTRVEGLVVEQNEAYMIEFVSKTASNSLAGVDNITVESFKCDSGYAPVKSEMLAYCASAIKTLPSCEEEDCEPFYTIHHGNVDVTNTTYGIIATITCHVGYELNGSSTAECGSNGKWNHTGQTCVSVDCGTFHKPYNGIVETTANTYGSIATVTCHTGYNLGGSSTSTCSSNGKWSSTGQLCIPVDCGPFSRPTKSRLSTGLTTYNSTVTITCFPGYKLSGNSTSTCGENGNWRNADQECVLQTVFLQVPEASCTFADNDTCNCDISKPSLPMEGNVTFNILHEMNDSFSLSGQGVSCYIVTPDNASVQSNTSFTMTSPTLQPGLYLISFQHKFSFGELHITVETDANKTKDVTYIERDQRWMNETVILTEERRFRVVFHAYDTKGGHLRMYDIQILKACDLLNLTNGHITVDHNTAYFHCNEGYRLVGNSSANCTQWAWDFEEPSCELIDCGTFHRPKNTHLSTGPTIYNSTVTITCFPGYKLSGNINSTCGENGKWRNADQECVLQTVFLQVPEAICTYADNNTCGCDNISHVLSLGDASCYIVIHDNTSVQSNTSFTMISPTLPPGLYLISFQHTFFAGELLVTVEKANNTTKDLKSFWNYVELDKGWLNETVILTEERDFRIVVRANETKDGLLQIHNIQILKACDLLNITNGQITVDHRTAYFRCNVGYRLVGNSSATCIQWSWTSDAPSCELIDCGTPKAPSNGHVTSTSTSYGSYSTISCNYSYFMEGIYMGLCDTNGKWSTENTTCLSIDSTMSSAVNPGCSHYSWNITVNLTMLRRLFPNYKTELQIFLGITHCKGEERNGFLVYDNDFNECLTQRKVSANLVTFENRLVLVFNPQNSLSSKEFNWTENVHCNVVDKGAVSSISTNYSQSDVNSISISVYSDPFFQTRLPSNPLHVHIGDTVYVKVSSPNLDQEIKLQLKSCFVRPTLDTDSRLDSLLIQNGCEVESGTHMISVEAHEIKFLFQNYEYVSHREGMNVFCNVAYCYSQDLSVDCTQTCTGMLGPVIVG